MSDFHSRMERYLDHWSSKPNAPTSIGWLEAAFNWLRKGIWRPLARNENCVDHRLISHGHATFEELIPDFLVNSEEPSVQERIENAQLVEMKHRVFRAIYWGNLFDDILPIEARYYTSSTERVVKLLVIVLMSWVVLAAVTLMPSYLNNNFSVSSALLKTSNARLSMYLESGQLAERFIQETGVKFPPVTNYDLSNTGSLLDSLLSVRKKTNKLVSTADLDSSSWLPQKGWGAANETDRRRVIADAVFFYRIQINPEPFQTFNNTSKLVVAPNNNWQEVASQLAVVAFIVCMVSWFLAKKSHFVETLMAVDFAKRIPSISALEEILISFFSLRKKYHYSVAFLAAAIAMFLHYYTMDRVNFSRSADAAIALNLKSFDYRMSSSDQPLLATYWLAQFVVVYIFTLVAWELGALSNCFRQWQGQMLKVKIISEEKFEGIFRNLVNHQKGLLTFCGASAIAVLGALSVIKFLKLQPENTLAMEISWSALESVFTWENWLTLYIFSPPILSFIVVVYALKPCFVRASLAIKYSDKKLPDLDKVLESLLRSWKKIGLAEEWATKELKSIELSRSSDLGDRTNG